MRDRRALAFRLATVLPYVVDAPVGGRRSPRRAAASTRNRADDRSAPRRGNTSSRASPTPSCARASGASRRRCSRPAFVALALLQMPPSRSPWRMEATSSAWPVRTSIRNEPPEAAAPWSSPSSYEACQTALNSSRERTPIALHLAADVDDGPREIVGDEILALGPAQKRREVTPCSDSPSPARWRRSDREPREGPPSKTCRLAVAGNRRGSGGPCAPLSGGFSGPARPCWRRCRSYRSIKPPRVSTAARGCAGAGSGGRPRSTRSASAPTALLASLRPIVGMCPIVV